MGHANRSWLDDALGVDAQPRGVCFPASWRWGKSNTNSYSYSYSNSDGHSNTNSDTYAEAYSNGEAASNAAAAPVSPGCQVICEK